MRIDAAKNMIDFDAWAQTGSPLVRFRIGWQRYTATVDEAETFGQKLIEAAREARS